MKIKINNVRISLLHETTLEQAVCKKAGVGRESLGTLRILRKAVDARKKNDICLNYHVLAEVDVSARQVKRLLADRDITQYEKPVKEPLVLGTLPLNAPPVVIGAGPAGLLAALQLAEHGYRPLLLERGKPVAGRTRRRAARRSRRFARAGRSTRSATCSSARAARARFPTAS